MEIKILGMGCSKCKVTEKQVLRAIKELGRNDIIVSKIEDLKVIMNYNILSTPALVIDEVVVVSGRIPSTKEIKDLINRLT
jgi:small redox-active disulfide protein 2